jgi:hypothetical protein
MHPILLLLATILATLAAADPLRVEVACGAGCLPDDARRVEAAFRAALDRHGFQAADSDAKAPKLRSVAYQADGSWFLSPTLLSPKGSVATVSREEFPSLDSLLANGPDSALASARRTIDEFTRRARERKDKP